MKFFSFFIFLLIPNFLLAQVNTQSESFDVNLIVEGCNNNSICEPGIGEDVNSCPLDCAGVTIDEDEDDDRDGRSGGRIFIDDFSGSSIENILEVSNAKVVLENKTVSLYWNNPPVGAFDFIRVVQSSAYTQSPYEGVVVYEGLAEYWSGEVDQFGKNYFYTIFVKNNSGQYSDGIGFLVNARNPSIVEDVNSEVDDVDFVENQDKGVVWGDYLNLYDIVLTQGGYKLRWKKDSITTNNHENISIFIPKKGIFDEIKDFYVFADFYNQEDKFFKREIIKLDYSASLQGYSGEFIEIKDAKKIKARFSIIKESSEEGFVVGNIIFDEKLQSFPEENYSKIYIILGVIALIILWILILLNKRKTLDK